MSCVDGHIAVGCAPDEVTKQMHDLKRTVEDLREWSRYWRAGELEYQVSYDVLQEKGMTLAGWRDVAGRCVRDCGDS